MTLTTIQLISVLLGTLLGGTGIGAAILKLITLKSEKRMVSAEAEKAQDDVSFIRDALFKGNYEFLEERLTNLNLAYAKMQDEALAANSAYQESISKLTVKIHELQKLISNTLLEVNYYKGLCCSDLTCPNRKNCGPFNTCCD